MSDIVIVVCVTALGIFCMREVCSNTFYKAYFNQKQKNAGRDPVEVLKKEFPNPLLRWLVG